MDHRKGKPKSTPRAREQAQRRRSRGRPSKAERERILREHGFVVAEEFRFHPLRSPVDPQFALYYEQLLKGNAQALSDYCDENRKRPELDASFYEFLGRLVTLRFCEVADVILSDVERRGFLRKPSRLEVYRYWYGQLEPACVKAREFIAAVYEAGFDGNREKLWNDFLQSAENALRQERRRQEIEGLARWAEIPTNVQWSAVPQLPSPLSQVNEFKRYGLVPKEVFFKLAESRMSSQKRIFKLKPSQVAGNYAGQIARISPSTASHASK